jgi:hypothetical protein
MDKPYLRHQILKHKTLLHHLYSQTKVQQTLNNASNDGLNFLLKLLHLITNGHIKLPKGAYETIEKSLRGKKLSQFESKSYLHSLLVSTREEKLTVLRQFNKLYLTFFHYIFNPTKSPST